MKTLFANPTTSLVYHVAAIYILFILNSIFQEKLATNCSGKGKKFPFPYFLILIQSLANLLLSRGTDKRLNLRLLLYYTLLAFLNIMNSSISYYSLSYMDYPSLLITKSCKLLPIAICKYTIFNQKQSKIQIISIILTTVSVFAFTSGGSVFISKAGVPLILTSLFLDGIVNSLQDHIFEQFKVSSANMMFYSNIFSVLFSAIYIIITRQFMPIIAFLIKQESVVFDICCSTIFGCFGQILIYSMLSSHGSLVLTTVNITRKVVSILISIVFFGHGISVQQIVGIFILVAAICVGISGKKTKSSRYKK